MEACSGAHHWARLFQSHGHTVRLMAPKFVAPYRKAVVAISAKNARMAWAVLTKGEAFRLPTQKHPIERFRHHVTTKR